MPGSQSRARPPRRPLAGALDALVRAQQKQSDVDDDRKAGVLVPMA
ncbi:MULTISPECIES: hypothetical protein [Thermomonosporaceae]|nr:MULTISPECIES: hypothetical protein [Thermomonosporaceae]MDL4773733.1 hypothetical protein [Actinomadura xylanilytica]